MDEKKEQTVPGVQDGVHKDPEGPKEEAPYGTLRVPTGWKWPEGQPAKKQEKKVKEPHELQEEAWRLMNEAVTTGKMVLESGLEVHLNADSLIRVIQWLASAKAKKPHLISVPEDFDLKETTEGKNEKKAN